MSFVGRLDQFQLADLLQIVASNRKTGKLNLTRSDAEGIIVFREGEIVYASSSAARETLGHLLLCGGLISQDQLVEALEIQHSDATEQRLGTILIDAGHVTSKDLEQVLRQQLEKVLSEFLQWQQGFFKFEPFELIDHGEISIDTGDLLLAQGVSPGEVLEELEAKLAEEEAIDLDDLNAQSGTQRLVGLRALMEEIRSPEFTGEVTSALIEFGKGVFARGVLFILSQGNFVSMGHFGFADGEGPGRGSLKLPKNQPSILSRAAEGRTTQRGKMERLEWNLYLLSHLGGIQPTESAALPLLLNGETMLVLYGDNAGHARPIGSLDDFELLLLQAGLAMEKQLLEKRIEQFEKLRRS
ncbi:MAG: DUF4388 domain-containing protein [bacterium]|nr:DUF4388 domain-containing protein [bacterium]